MIPFLGMGIDQLAERVVGKPGTEDNVNLGGDDETDEKAQYHSCQKANTKV